MDVGRRRWRVVSAAFASAVTLLVSACESTGDSPGGDVDLAYIDGMGVNPKDGKLYVASHHGLFLVAGDGAATQIAGRTQDFMGFTVVGPDHFLGSGASRPRRR